MRKIFSNFIKEKNFIFFLLTIVILGSIPRSIEIISGNYLFGYDQGVFFQAVKEIVVNHKFTLIGTEVGGGGFFQGPGWYYLLSVPFYLWKGDPYGGMMLMLASGILTVIFSVICGRKMFDVGTALAIGFFVAISPAIIAQSRFIWPPFIISLLSVFFIFFLYNIFKGAGKFFILLTFIVGLMFHFEIATGATLLLQLLIISPLLFFKKIVSLKFFIFGLLSFLSTQISLFIFDLRHDFLNIKGIINLFMNGKGDSSIDRINLIANHVGVFKSNFLSSFQMADLLWPFLFVILAIGLISYLRDKKNSKAKKWLVLYLATSPITLFTVFIFYPSTIWEWWILELIIFYCFLFGVILIHLFRNKLMRVFVVGICLISFLSFVNKTIFFYKNDFNDFGGVHKIKGKIEAIDYIYKDAGKREFSIIIFTPPVYTYAYDYLIWWHGSKNYGYVPHKEKKNIFYLLMEPDPSKLWSYEGWLETIIKTGTILETRELSSGFVVQKRVNTE
ncbi:MAG: hypothetical protein Q7K54_00650 [Candidatus Parcubacteria bacterium]|nr:hypothetical protein [Candidatus Parcubacteria bacterium]